MNDITTIVIAVVSSGALFGFIEYLIKRYDAKHNKNDEVLKKLDSLGSEIASLKKETDFVKLSGLRTELDTAIFVHPEDIHRIMIIAEKYFTSGGDWYYTSVFKKFLDQNDIPYPEWFDDRK